MDTILYTTESLNGINPAHTAHLLTNLHTQRDALVNALRLMLADGNCASASPAAITEAVRILRICEVTA
jgi:hypothetical protein